MAIPYSPSPLTIAVNPTYTFRNVQYGWHPRMQCSVYRTPYRRTGGNPVLFLPHGGSWLNNDHNEFAEITGSGTTFGFMFASRFRNIRTWVASPRYDFDVVSLGYRCFREGASFSAAPTDLTDWIQADTGFSGNPKYQSMRGRLTDPIYDVQRCLQFFARYAEENAGVGEQFPIGDMDRSNFFLMGHSVGGNLALGAAFKRSRPWNPSDPSPFAAHHKARVKGVAVVGAEVDLDPWYMYHQHARNCAEIHDTDATRIRSQMERLFLQPNALGLYPQGSAKTELCKALSPVDQIADAPSDRSSTRVIAYYYKDFGGGTFESTLANQGNYSAIPPYNAAGHDWHQWQTLKDACEAKDAVRGDGLTMFLPQGKVWTQADYPEDSGISPDLGYLNALAEGAADTYDAFCDLIDGIDPAD